MELEPSSLPETSPEERQLSTAVERAAHAWRQSLMRVRSVTPRGLARLFLVFAAFIALGWLIWKAGPALVPFVVGGIIAYALLPIVDRLDRIMPRIVAALVALLGLLALIGLILALLLPPLAEQIFRVYVALPPIDELKAEIDDLTLYIETLPQPTQDAINTVADQVTERLRENLDLYLGGLVDVVIGSVLGLINTIGFVLGLLVIPAWLLSVLEDKEKGVAAINRMVPDRLEDDFWTILGIIDRPFNAFIRGQTIVALSVGLLTYAGFLVLEWLGVGVIPYKGLLAAIVGLARLIPTVVGTIVGLVPLLIAGFSISNEVGIGVLAVFIAAQWLANTQVTSRVERNIVDVHPAVLVIAIVAVSELGILWVFLAAPFTAIFRDLIRYLYGRFSEPPKPAGLLPYESIDEYEVTVESPQTAQAQRVPLAYRRGRISRPISTRR